MKRLFFILGFIFVTNVAFGQNNKKTEKIMFKPFWTKKAEYILLAVWANTCIHNIVHPLLSKS